MDNITKQLQGCSKSELIEVIMEMKSHSIGIGVTLETVIANARLKRLRTSWMKFSNTKKNCTKK